MASININSISHGFTTLSLHKGMVDELKTIPDTAYIGSSYNPTSNISTFTGDNYTQQLIDDTYTNVNNPYVIAIEDAVLAVQVYLTQFNSRMELGITTPSSRTYDISLSSQVFHKAMFDSCIGVLTSLISPPNIPPWGEGLVPVRLISTTLLIPPTSFAEDYLYLIRAIATYEVMKVNAIQFIKSQGETGDPSLIPPALQSSIDLLYV